jgi:hypothetical protein
MKKHQAQNELEKAEGALRVAQERLDMVNVKLPELENELEELIVTNELKGYKAATVKRKQSEIAKIQTEREVLLKTISALNKRMPDLQKAARIETASTETAAAYQDAVDQFKVMFDNTPLLDAIIGGIEAIESHVAEVQEAQDRYHKLARGLNAVMLSEGITSAGEVTVDRLFVDKNDIPYGKLFAVSEALTAIIDRISGLQNSISTVKDFNRLFFKLERPIEATPQSEFSADGKYKIAHEMGYWRLYEKRMTPTDDSFVPKPTWLEISCSINKPDFPSDQAPKRKPKPEAEEVRTGPGMSQLYPVGAAAKPDPDARRPV